MKTNKNGSNKMQTVIFALYRSFIIALSVHTVLPIAYAQEKFTQQIVVPKTDAIITYGTRTSRSYTDMPYTLHVLTFENLQNTLPRTLPESLKMLPGVLVQKTAAGHGSPYIRGFTGNRTLAVIDGIRYNNATYRDGANEYFSQIDTFTLEQIELLSGPTSVLYGSEAVGGTLSLRTKDSGFQDENWGGSFIKGQQIIRLSSGDDSVISRTNFQFGNGGHWGVRGGLSVKKFGDVNAATLGALTHTGYDETAWDIRLDARLNDHWNTSFVHHSLRQDDVWRTHSTIFSVPFAGTTIGENKVRLKDHARSLSYIKLNGRPKTTVITSAEITLSHQERKENSLRVRADDSVITQGFDSDLYAVNSVFESQWDGFVFVYGFDLSSEMIGSNREDFTPITNTLISRIQGPVGDDAQYDQMGLFVQSTYNIADAWDVGIGGRLSNISAKIGKYEDPYTGLAISFKDSWSDASLSARLNYKWGDAHRSNIWLSLSESFRAPNIADISRFGRSRSTEFETAAFGLVPEKFLTSEIGYRIMKGGFEFSSTYYYTNLENYIDTIPTGRIVDNLTEVSKANSASGYIQGIEFTGSYALSDTLFLKANATWVEGQISRRTNTGTLTEPISRIMPITGNISINWTGCFLGVADNLQLSADLKLVGKADKLSAADLQDTQRIPIGGTPHYTVFNLQGNWDVNERIQINLNANNLMDTAYRAHGSGSNEAGRHVMLGMILSF